MNNNLFPTLGTYGNQKVIILPGANVIETLKVAGSGSQAAAATSAG